VVVEVTVIMSLGFMYVAQAYVICHSFMNISFLPILISYIYIYIYIIFRLTFH